MLQVLLVFFGGGLGSLTRYLVSKLIISQFPTLFPLGTFTVNIAGSFIIGLVISSVEKYSFNPQISLLLATGFCGGFTTFSTFAYENNLYLKNNDYILLLGYTLMSLFWGISATFLGMYLVRKL